MPMRIEHRPHRDAAIRESATPWPESFIVYQCDVHPDVQAEFDGPNYFVAITKAYRAGWRKSLGRPFTDPVTKQARSTGSKAFGPCCTWKNK